MITTLDTQSWSQELVTGNAEFVQTPNQTLFIVSNVKRVGFGNGFGGGFGSSPFAFDVLKSAPVPPAPGPGSAFSVAASYVFPQPNQTFDPTAIYDPTTGLIHILGTRNTPTGLSTSSTQLSDVIKFTFNTANNHLTGPFVISASMGSRIRSSYDLCMAGGNNIIAMSLNDPAIQNAQIKGVLVSGGVVVVTVATMSQPFVPGQWVVPSGVLNAGFLNGQVLQVLQGTPTFFTASIQNSNYNAGGFGNQFGLGFGAMGSVPDTGTVLPVGSSLLALELDSLTNAPVPGSSVILDSSPSRLGNTFDGVSLVDAAGSTELYYQSHPKVITYQDQVFNIRLITRRAFSGFGFEFGQNFGESQGFGFDYGDSFGTAASSTIWDAQPTTLTTFSARYSDNRLTVFIDPSGTRYLSQTYFTQTNHPEGITGNALLGINPNGSWNFHVTPGSVVGGSIVQGSLSLAQTQQGFGFNFGRNFNIAQAGLHYTYLLEPFQSVPPPSNLPSAFSFRVAAVSPSTMAITDQPGFYNNRSFTWLRGTKSIMDNASLWAAVGEQEILSTVNESQLIPSTTPFSLLVANANNYWQNASVVDGSGTAPRTLTVAIDNPTEGQYVAESNGEYVFAAADASVGIVGLDLTGNILTVTGNNIANLRQGMQLLFRGLTHSTYLNNQTVTVTGISLLTSTFTANFTHSNDPQHSETGLVGRPLTITYSFISSINPVYLSLFNVPPVAALTPQSAVVFRGQPLLLNASASADADNDPLVFTWTENDPDTTNVTLSASNSTAALSVSPAVGGNQQAHITNVSLTANVVTLTAINTFSSGQIVQVKNLTGAAFLNGANLTISSASGTQFTAPFTHANYSSASDSGDAGVYRNLNVGVAVVDLFSDQTPRHGSSPVSNVQVDGLGTITVTAQTLLAPGETVMLYGVQTLGAVPVSTVSDRVYTVVTWSPTSFTATTTGTLPPLVSTPVTGFVIPQFQFAVSSIQVPFNAAPTIVFPSPQWITSATITNFQIATNLVTFTAVNAFTAGDVVTISGLGVGTYLNGQTLTILALGLSGTQFQAVFNHANVGSTADSGLATAAPQVNVPRNSSISLVVNPTGIVPYPVLVTGANDPDDTTSYLWEQLSGTTVLPGAVTPGHLFPFATTPTLTFLTNGVDIHGETLSFRLTVNDGVNAAVSRTFTVGVAAYNFTSLDTKQLSRSVWLEQDAVTNIAIASNVLTVTAANTFALGQSVTFNSLANATLLNNIQPPLVILSLIGAGPVFTGFTAAAPTLPNYASTPDTGFVTAPARISQRNTAQTWGPLDKSTIYTNLSTIKRISVLDGTDRYIVISPNSVLIYGGINPVLFLLRKLLTPNGTTIVDAVHTEDDYTLVLDNQKNLFRYSTAPLINSDNPDTTINLNAVSSLRFNKVFSTASHANIRVLAFSGPDGCLLMQVDNTTLNIQGTLSLTTTSNLVVGSNNVQFIRLSNVETLNSGKILIGTVTNVIATVTAVSVSNNTVTLTSLNNFVIGDVVQFSGFSGPTAFLNGLMVSVISSTATQFVTSLQTPNLNTIAAPAGALATALNDGKTYETLIDLTHSQIIGTWDASKLRNQFVNTGEILFEPDSSYSGRPLPPVQGVPIVTQTANGPTITIVWTEKRPDLVSGYNIEYAVENNINLIVGGSLTFMAPTTYGTTVGVTEAQPITQIAISGNVLTVTVANTYAPGTQITLNGLSTAAFLNGQIVTVLTATGTQFTANFTHATYAPAIDGGSATQTLTTVGANPGANQYSVSSSGLYTFNIVQLGSSITIGYLSPFALLQQVTSGSIQKTTFALSSGSYAFRITAQSLDGPSDFSNVQVISY